MHYTLFMKIINRQNELCSIEFYGLFLKSPLMLCLLYFKELTSTEVWHYEIEAHLTLEQVVHAHQERMITLQHYVLLQ